MIDAEKLLGGLLGGSSRGLGGLLGGKSGSGLPSGAAVGMGLLGVAMAAFEHFAEQRENVSAGSGSVRPIPPSAPAGGPPPAPGTAMPTTPPPMPGSVPPPPIPEMTYGAAAAPVADPMLLIRAMIASANADGVLDETERMRILGQLDGVGLTEEEKDFLVGEFGTPWSLRAIAEAVTSPSVGAQVFTVSLLAVDVDSVQERDYFEALRLALNLDESVAQNIARRLGRQL